MWFDVVNEIKNEQISTFFLFFKHTENWNLVCFFCCYFAHLVLHGGLRHLSYVLQSNALANLNQMSDL